MKSNDNQTEKQKKEQECFICKDVPDENKHPCSSSLPNEKNAPKLAKTRPFIGLIFALASAFFLSLAGVLARKCVIFTASEITLLSFIMVLITMTILMARKAKSPLGPKGHRSLMTARALLYALTIFSTMTSVKLISPSDTMSLFHTNVIFLTILSRLIFKEKMSFIHVICLFMAIIGKLNDSFLFDLIF